MALDPRARRAKALRDQGKTGRQIAHALQVDYRNDPDAVALIGQGYIADLQERLKALGFYAGNVDGECWNLTHKAMLEAIDAAECPPTLPDGSSGAMRSPASMTLGERALDWCLTEAESWGDRQVSEKRLCDYLIGCERDGSDALGKWLANKESATPGRDFSFCAAAQGCAEDRVRLPDEELPPWRAGALEIMRDAQAGRRPGEQWRPLAEVIDLGLPPPPGAIAVYSNTASSWRGHVERVIGASATGYRSVGANENNGRWVVDRVERRYGDAGGDGVQRLRLEGFIVPEHHG
ncbi:MAG: hypothetical protein R3337_00130 [Gammaproteobacteria bacterium]|nr:hypothetical protein [Gammaproteobacteria bacterium]